VLTTAVAGVALLVAGLVFTLRPDSTAHALATPPLLSYEPVGQTDAARLLHEIADRTQALPDDTGSGRYTYTNRKGWHLHSTVLGRSVTSEVVPEEVETWFADDGSGRRRLSATLPGGEVQADDERWEAGHGKLSRRDPLPVEAALLEAELARTNPAANGPAQRIVAVTDYNLERPVEPALRAALLRYLAATPTITITGKVTDRAGRQGIGFHVDSAYSGLPSRYTVIVDPGNGQLLAREDVLTTSAGALNVPIPSVKGYTVFQSAGHTDSLQ
jgi:hypothetical protein